MFLFAWLALAGLSWAAVAPPRQGIEQNVGQQNPDVLFVYGDQAFFPGRVQLTGVAKLSVAFSGSNAAARPEGRDRLAFPVERMHTSGKRTCHTLPPSAISKYIRESTPSGIRAFAAPCCACWLHRAPIHSKYSYNSARWVKP